MLLRLHGKEWCTGGTLYLLLAEMIISLGLSCAFKCVPAAEVRAVPAVTYPYHAHQKSSPMVRIGPGPFLARYGQAFVLVLSRLCAYGRLREEERQC